MPKVTNAFRCPECGAHTSVLSTRGTRRRRECFEGHRFSTEEAVVESVTRKADWREVAEAEGPGFEVAAVFGVSPASVYRWRKQLAAERAAQP